MTRLCYRPVNSRGYFVRHGIGVAAPVICKEKRMVGGKILGAGTSHSALSLGVVILPNFRMILRALGILIDADIVL